jgi:hypothetical protein
MEDKTNNEIIADALVRILENQIKIKVHLGIARDDSEYGDCYYDHRMIDNLRYVD